MENTVFLHETVVASSMTWISGHSRLGNDSKPSAPPPELEIGDKHMHDRSKSSNIKCSVFQKLAAERPAAPHVKVSFVFGFALLVADQALVSKI